MTLREMLGAVRASVEAARGGGGEVSERSSSLDDGFCSETAAGGGEVSTEDVPDLGPLMFLGTDRRGREVAEAVNLHWRAHAKLV